MKLIIAALILISTSAFATEVETDCPAMNQNREKVISKSISMKKMKSTAIRQ